MSIPAGCNLAEMGGGKGEEREWQTDKQSERERGGGGTERLGRE